MTARLACSVGVLQNTLPVLRSHSIDECTPSASNAIESGSELETNCTFFAYNRHGYGNSLNLGDIIHAVGIGHCPMRCHLKEKLPYLCHSHYYDGFPADLGFLDCVSLYRVAMKRLHVPYRIDLQAITRTSILSVDKCNSYRFAAVALTCYTG